MMQPNPEIPYVPFLRYPGAKFRLSTWLLRHVPDHDCYNAPFAGSAALFFRKPRAPLEALNDADGDVVNLFRQLRDRPGDLIRAIRYTPWSLAEYRLAQEASTDPLEQARRFYFRCWASIRPFSDHPSFRRQKILSRGRNGTSPPMAAAARSFKRVKHLYALAERLRGVTIEQLDAVDFVNLYDHPRAFFYCDPPYLPATCSSTRPHYAVTMNGEAEHRRLARTLHAAAGMVAISHYPCPLYTDLYESAGWKRVDRNSRINGGGTATESLWLSPHTYSRLQEDPQPCLI